MCVDGKFPVTSSVKGAVPKYKKRPARSKNKYCICENLYYDCTVLVAGVLATHHIEKQDCFDCPACCVLSCLVCDMT